MVTQIQIEDKGFTYWKTSKESNNRPERDEYLAEGVRYKGLSNEFTILLLLSYDISDVMTITDYFNDPVPYREYYLSRTKVSTEEELNKALSSTRFETKGIKLEELTTKYR